MTSTTPTSTPIAPEPARPGRRRDPALDAAILEAAAELVASDGYDGCSMDRVAALAKASKATVYRRWPSKAALVVDTLLHLKSPTSTIDTGSLDGDLDALMEASCSSRSGRATRVMAGVAAVLGREPELLDAFRSGFVEPRVRRIADVIERAQARGEVSTDIDVDVVARVMPSMMFQQLLLTGKPAGRDFAHRILEGVLKPLLHHPSTRKPSHA